MGQYCFTRCHLSSSSSVTRISSRPPPGQWSGRSGGRHCTAGQYGYVPTPCYLNRVIYKEINKHSILTLTDWYCTVIVTEEHRLHRRVHLNSPYIVSGKNINISLWNKRKHWWNFIKQWKLTAAANSPTILQDCCVGESRALYMFQYVGLHDNSYRLQTKQHKQLEAASTHNKSAKTHISAVFVTLNFDLVTPK